jgi:hypothetical protein
MDEWKLRGSSSSLEGIIKMVNKYFYTTFEAVYADDNLWAIYYIAPSPRAGGVLNNYRIKKQRGRYRLEERISR